MTKKRNGKLYGAAVTRRHVIKSGALTAGSLFTRNIAVISRSLAVPTWAHGDGICEPSLRCEYLVEPLGLQTKTPRLSWTETFPVGISQNSYQISVSSRADGNADLWDTGRVYSHELAAVYAGKALSPHQQAFWRVRAWGSDGRSVLSSVSRWSVGPLTDQDWEPSQWIGRDDILENTQDKMPGETGPIVEPNFYPAPYLRRQFVAEHPVESAFIYACAPGFAELHLNGQKLGTDTERDPGFSNFDRRLLYVTHDVKGILRPGSNVLGAILGTGWFDVHDVATWHLNTAPWRQRPRLRLALYIKYRNGRSTIVGSDSQWRSAVGPILRDGIYTGEVYDSRCEMLGWSTPEFDDAAWKPVLVVEAPRGRLTPLTCEPVRVTQTLTPIAITEPKPGVFIVNMGQNFSGHTQLRVKGPAGHRITMRYAEILNEDGTLNSKPIDHFMETTKPRQPFQEDTYICKGDGTTEVWEQRFSWSGFQYVEVTNFPGKPTIENFRGRFAHTDLASAGEFECSSETANRIQHATRWSFLSNAQSYPTDCPQREKNGWTGDAGLAVEAGLMNFQSVSFYRKWLDDFADAQRPDGGVPVLVPNGGWGNGEHWPGDICPPWDAAYITITWQLYRFTGDKSLLARHVNSLKRYVDFFLSHRESGGLAPALGIGDWSPWKTTTPLDFITNAYLYLDLVLISQMFGVLGSSVDQARYATLAAEIGALTHKRFYSRETRRYSNGSQMAQGTALFFGFVPDAERDAVFSELVGQIEQLGHLDVGFLGAKHVLRALAEGGRADLAYRIATQPTMPSYGYWVDTAKSTTLWEGWTAGPSYNHIMFGDISAWFYQWIAGIQQEKDSVGFTNLVFRPSVVGSLTRASARYASQRGIISSAWELSGKGLSIELQVPSGATARIENPRGFIPAQQDFGSFRRPLGSGTHRFEMIRS